VVQSIVGLAANLGFGCIAEGVETAEQRDHLRRLGCSEMQGFLFSKPLPAEAAGKLLKARVKSLEIEAHG
jgi:EAL domain-containing protein (putative c-di-GMP-specific phosphodiesterase class I)